MKRGLAVVVFLSLILILSLTFVSAGFFSDLFKKFTGEVIDPVPRTDTGQTCGDSVCNNYETCSTCSTDCGNCDIATSCTCPSDGNICTLDSCSSGKCTYNIIAGCCTSDSQCPSATGTTAATSLKCVNNVCVTPSCTCANDNNVCTTDACVQGTTGSVCQHVQVPNCCVSDSQCNSATSIAQKRCVNNVCVSGTSVSCFDSDGGNDTYRKGNTSNPKTGVISLTDVCASRVYYGTNSQYETIAACSAGPDCFIGEAVCDATNTNWEQKIIACPNGCKDGACVASKSCTSESDASFCSRSRISCGNVSGVDNCGNARTVKNCGTCVSPQTCNWQTGQCVASCGAGVSCDDYNSCTVDACASAVAASACIHTAITTCKNADGCCPTGCNSDNDNDCISIVNFCGDLKCNSGETCSNCRVDCGGCVAPKCVDSDKGTNYYTPGNVTYTYGSLSTVPNDKLIISDYCSGNRLNEAYCFVDDNKVAQYSWGGIVCPKGCANGACQRGKVTSWISNLF